MSEYQLFMCLAKFGRITTVEMKRQGKAAFITFENHSKLKQLKNLREVDIGYGQTIRIIKWTNPPRKDRAKLRNKRKLAPIPAPPAKRRNIMYRLNDDCIEELFEYCAPMGENLLQLVQVCYRFRELCLQFFAKQCIRKGDFFHKHLKDKPVHYIAQYFETFGAFMTVVRVSHILNTPDIVCNLALLNCPHISALKCKMTHPATIRLARCQISRLDELHLSLGGRNIMDLRQLLGSDANLRTLHIRDIKCKRIIFPARVFPTLLTLGLRMKSADISLERFLQQNPQIKTVHAYSQHFSKILDNIPNAEELCLTCPKRAMPSLRSSDNLDSARNLRNVRLTGRSLVNPNFAPVLYEINKHEISIERLMIDHMYFYDGDVMHFVLQKDTLRFLHLSHIQYGKQLIDSVEHLPQLKEIVFESEWNVMRGIEASIEVAKPTFRRMSGTYGGKEELAHEEEKSSKKFGDRMGRLGRFLGKSISVVKSNTHRMVNVSVFLGILLNFCHFFIFIVRCKTVMLRQRAATIFHLVMSTSQLNHFGAPCIHMYFSCSVDTTFYC